MNFIVKKIISIVINSTSTLYVIFSAQLDNSSQLSSSASLLNLCFIVKKYELCK